MAERIAVMNFGVLQQAGTFDEVYNHPVNEFVAGFIGEPPMNFLACTPQHEGADLFLQAVDGSFKLLLPSDLRAKLENQNVETVHLGIRPTDLTIANGHSTDGTLDVQAVVNTYESLGEEGQLAAQIGKTEVLVVTPAFLHLTTGDPITLNMRTERVHLFDAATELAL